jgi:hypothetical protein
MAQLQATRTGPATIDGLDDSLIDMLPGAAGLREWGARIGVFASLGLGWLIANRLPALELAGGGTLSLDEVTDRLTAQSNGWIFSLVWFAGILTCIASVVFPPSERFAQVLAVTVGGLATMAGPYYVWSHRTDIDEAATGLGSGLVIAWVGCALAVASAWAGVLWWNRVEPVFGRDWSKWMFLLPAMVWILALTVFPLIFAITTSTYFYRSGRFANTVGADNFRRLFVEGGVLGRHWSGPGLGRASRGGGRGDRRRRPMDRQPAGERGRRQAGARAAADRGDPGPLGRPHPDDPARSPRPAARHHLLLRGDVCRDRDDPGLRAGAAAEPRDAGAGADPGDRDDPDLCHADRARLSRSDHVL